MSSSYDSLLLSLNAWNFKPKTTSHSSAPDSVSWNNALQNTNTHFKYNTTKTLILKPKTQKTQSQTTTTPVLLIALENTETNLNALAKKLSFKELRIAGEDILDGWFHADKATVGPFSLANVPEDSLANVKIVIDSALLNSPTETLFAFRASSDDHTAFLTSKQLLEYFAHLKTQTTEIDFVQLATTDLKSLSASDSASVAKKNDAAKTKKEKTSAPASSKADNTIQIGIEFKKAEDFPRWYQQVLTKSEMLEYYDVSGCYIIRPWAFNVWKEITAFFDAEITKMGVEGTYFPMFVSNKVLEREKDHIEGFAPEVAWVTRAGSSDLEEPLAIRPTSETVMYPYFAKWIRSHRDLPLKLNQWCNVVRWEFKNPQPFIRTREFLWQEGHTAHLTKAEADTEVHEILDLYRQVYEDVLAMPVIKGVKSEKEKFAGGLYTTTVEGYIPTTGRGLQCATSHCLGQNFSKMFNITVEDPSHTGEGEAGKLHVWQNSWGLTTRTIGAMVMVHGDDKGLVMPPRVASVQVIVVPCGLTVKSTEDNRKNVEEYVKNVVKTLLAVGVKAKADLRDNYTPGYKFNHWELRGVPVRLEVGPMDIAKSQTLSVRRDTGFKSPLSLSTLAQDVPRLLETIQQEMFQRAKKVRDANVKQILKWEDFVPQLDSKGFCLMPWCERQECEEEIKVNSARIATANEPEDEKAPSMGAKSLCIPFEQPTDHPIVAGTTKCVACGTTPAVRYALFGRSY